MRVWVSMSQDSSDSLHFEGFNQTSRGLLTEFPFSHKNIAPKVSDPSSYSEQP
uniref:Uncharacterized protein n=1 Tax=Arundo donax TaxID=35708 RepID=A0A0A9CW01_ARUDO